VVFRRDESAAPYTKTVCAGTPEDGIAKLAAEWTCPLSLEQIARVAAFFRLLLQWNARVNLTGAGGMDELIAHHLPDSFALSRLVPSGFTVVDIGAGGGLPGVPFAILRPDCKTTLVEPRAKRTAFLGAALRGCGRPDLFEVVRGRDADVSAASFRVAASRATFAPLEWLTLAGRLLIPGGRAVVFASRAPAGGEGEWCLVDSVSYLVGHGAARWAGAYVPRGTIAVPA